MQIEPLRLNVEVSSAPAVTPALQERPSPEVIAAVQAINKSELLGARTELTFAVDRELKRPILRIVDRESGEVLQQYPPEYALELAKELVKQSGRGL